VQPNSWSHDPDTICVFGQLPCNRKCSLVVQRNPKIFCIFFFILGHYLNASAQFLVTRAKYVRNNLQLVGVLLSWLNLLHNVQRILPSTFHFGHV